MLIQIAEVPGLCPGLISINDMGELAIGFQFDKKVMTVGGKESPMYYTHSGHPKLDLLDYGDDDPAG
eukprot:8749925-Heterocapsa_arctica.AAC.1